MFYQNCDYIFFSFFLQYYTLKLSLSHLKKESVQKPCRFTSFVLVISVKYDTKRLGNFRKNVTLTTNVGPDPIKLVILGKVLKEEDAVPANDSKSLLAPENN